MIRDAWAELARLSDDWQANHPVRFYTGVFAFLAALVSLWLAGEADVVYAAMAGIGVALGIALGSRLRGER